MQDDVYFDQQMHAWACICMVNNNEKQQSTVAQMAERATQNQKGQGSIPACIQWYLVSKFHPVDSWNSTKQHLDKCSA